MRTALECPFVPGAGRVPEVWAGRETELADAAVAARRRLGGVYDRGRAVLGEYGLGKSVLVNRIAEDFRTQGHLVAEPVRIPAGGDPIALLARVLGELVRTHGLGAAIAERVTGLMDRITHVALPVIGGGLTVTPPDAELAYRDVHDLLVHVGRLARERDRLAMIRIDEVQNAGIAGLSRLLTVLGDALEATVEEVDALGTRRDRVLPVLVYVSGLPDFRRLAGDAGATFARRFRTFDLEYLSEPEMRTALLPFSTDGWSFLADDGPQRIHMDPGAIDLVVERSLGDPFLFQLAGEAAWQAGEGPLITRAEAERGWRLVRRETVRYVEGRLEGLSDLQLEVLEAAARIEPEAERTSMAVAVATGRTSSSQLASTFQSLDRTHRLIRREAGRLSFRSEAVRRFLTGTWP